MKTDLTVKSKKKDGVEVVISIELCDTLDEWRRVRTDRQLVAMLNQASEQYCRREATKLMRGGVCAEEIEMRFNSDVLCAPGPLKKTAAEVDIEKIKADPQLRMEFFRELVLDNEMMQQVELARMEKKKAVAKAIAAPVLVDPTRDMTPEEMKAAAEA